MSTITTSFCCRRRAGGAGGSAASATSALQPGQPLKLLRGFRATREWLLEPGDMLYLPPGVAHDGVADGECITYSIGFRAPTWQELLDPWLASFRRAHAH